MFYFILSLCAIAVTAVHVNYWLKKQRLLDQKIHQAIERKMNTGTHAIELAQLREEQMVMRNLLHDILENEASVRYVTTDTPDEDRVRVFHSRNQRRRELFGETLVVLGKATPDVSSTVILSKSESR